MAFNGSGTFVRVHDWTTDLANTVPVTASRMDDEMDGMATGLSTTICKDGQTTTTARIPFAVGVSSASGSVSAAAYAHTSDLNTGIFFPAADSVAITTDGAQRLTVDDNGTVSVRAYLGDLGTQSYAVGGATPQMVVHNSGGQYNLFLAGNGAAPVLYGVRSEHATPGSHTAVEAGHDLLNISAYGSDGTSFLQAGALLFEVDLNKVVGTNDMPGVCSIFTTQDGGTTLTRRLHADSVGNVVIGAAAIATNATDGFFYAPSCAGTPTGTPTTYTGMLPIVIDSTNNRLYFFSGGAWRNAGP